MSQQTSTTSAPDPEPHHHLDEPADAPWAPSVVDEPDHVDRRPKVNVTDYDLLDQEIAVTNAIVAANKPKRLFQRQGDLCQIVDREGMPVIDPVGTPQLIRRMCHDVRFVRTPQRSGQNKTCRPMPAQPSRNLANNILCAGDWQGVDEIKGVTTTPILRPDGTIHHTPGFDPQTGLFLDYNGSPLGRASKSRIADTDIAWARDLLLQDLLGDFPFASDADKANTLALALSPIVRPLISGHAPLCLVNAPVQGTGKTYLVQTVNEVAIGPGLAGEPIAKSEDEMRKKVTSILLRGSPVVLFDNLPDGSTLDSATLALALTSDPYSDRLLGQNKTVVVPSRSIWAATGNNIGLGGDMPRRCYVVHLESPLERPAGRGDFRRRDLLEYVAANRGTYLDALFVLARSWIMAGRPRPTTCPVPNFASFQGWADTIGGILDHAGLPGMFLANLHVTQAALDHETSQWTEFLRWWHESHAGNPMTAKQLIEAADKDGVSLPDVVSIGKTMPRSLASHLSKRMGRVYQGLRLVETGRYRGLMRYALQTPKSGPKPPRRPRSHPEATPKAPPNN